MLLQYLMAVITGYSIVEALWTTYSDLPEISRQGFIDAFYAAARAEGQIVNDDVNLILLESARDGGWPRIKREGR